MAVTNVNGQTTSNINTYGTSITNKTSVTTVVGISSSTVARIASSTTSAVSSTTTTVTSSTTQNINSSGTSKVTYSSTSVSSATPVSSSTTVTKNSSSIEMYVSSLTPVHNMLSSSTTVSDFDYMNDKEGVIAYMVDTYVDEYDQEYTNYYDIGFSYKLGEHSFYTMDTKLTFSSEITYHTEPEGAPLELSIDMQNTFKELSKMTDDSEFPTIASISFELLGEAEISIEDDGTSHLKVSDDDYEYDLNMSSLLAGKLELTISKSIDIEGKATLTNALKVERFLPSVPVPQEGTDAITLEDLVCMPAPKPFYEKVGEWVASNSKEIEMAANATAIAVIAGLLVYASGGSATSAIPTLIGTLGIH